MYARLVSEINVKSLLEGDLPGEVWQRSPGDLHVFSRPSSFSDVTWSEMRAALERRFGLHGFGRRSLWHQNRCAQFLVGWRWRDWSRERFSGERCLCLDFECPRDDHLPVLSDDDILEDGEQIVLRRTEIPGERFPFLGNKKQAPSASFENLTEEEREKLVVETDSLGSTKRVPRWRMTANDVTPEHHPSWMFNCRRPHASYRCKECGRTGAHRSSQCDWLRQRASLHLTKAGIFKSHCWNEEYAQHQAGKRSLVRPAGIPAAFMHRVPQKAAFTSP